MLNDELFEIFKRIPPIVGEEDSSINASEVSGSLLSCQSETENFQDDNIFDFIEKSYLEELPNEYHSILNFDSSEFIQSTETLKTDLNFENAFESNLSEPANENEARSKSAHSDKIVDIFDTLVDSDVLREELFLKSNASLVEEILRESLAEHPPNLNEKDNNVESFDHCDKEFSVNLRFQQTIETSCDKINITSHEIPDFILESALLNTVPSANLEILKTDLFGSSEEISNFSNTTALESHTPNSIQKSVQLSPKRPERLISPRLTEFCCEFCHPKLFFMTKNDLKSHSQSHKCQFCNEFFSDQMIEKHLKTNHKEKEVNTCVTCNSTFSNQKTFRNHLRKHRIRKCEKCSKELTESSFQNHLAKHDKSCRFYCEYCGLDFVSKIKLNEHLSVHTNVKPYVCNICGREFSSHGSFWIHKKWHQTPFPYKCNLCGRLFRHSSILALHRRKHSNFESEDQLCNQRVSSEGHSPADLASFHTKSTLNVDSGSNFAGNTSDRERLSHPTTVVSNCKKLKIAVSEIPKKEHICEFCSQKFQTSSSLIIHRRKHTKERPFKCTRCSKDFPSNNSLQKHKRNMSACLRWLDKTLAKSNNPNSRIAVSIISPFPDTEKQSSPRMCPHCNVSFPNEDALRKHIIMLVVSKV